MSKDHAEHNEKLCNFLLANGLYNDWVVTTAFYSSLHFVNSKIFPFEVGKILYSNFNEYFYKEVKPKNRNVSKHEATIKLVYQEITSIGANYKWLFDLCMTARYKKYIISPNEAKMAKSHLTKIKKFCK